MVLNHSFCDDLFYTLCRKNRMTVTGVSVFGTASVVSDKIALVSVKLDSYIDQP